MLQETSYGIVPVYNQLVCIIQHARNKSWGLPKGHAQEGEIPQTAALRELAEETGITDISLIAETNFSENYVYLSSAGNKISKTVIYWIGVTTSPDTKTQAPDVINSQFVSFDEAIAIVTYNETREIISKVREYLKVIH